MDKHEFEKVIKACRFCLMCRHLCTVGNITYAETNTPRGHALMIDCMGSEALRDTPENRKRAAEVFFSCCYCGHCQSNCVSSYRHPDAIMAARASVGDEDLPGRVAKLRRLVEKTGECYAAPAQAAGLRDASGGALRGGAGVLLYIGSFVRNEAPDIARAAMAVLDKAGVDYFLLPKETGTGMPAYLLGMPDAARAQLGGELQKIAALSPGKVVALSPEDQRALGGGVPGLEAPMLNAPVISFSAFVLDLIRSGRLAPEGGGPGSGNADAADAVESVAYHDSDQGGRFLEKYETPREVIKAVPGLNFEELFWSGGEAASAGESGLLRMLDGRLAETIAAKRLEQIEGRGIDVLVTDSPEAKAMLLAAQNGVQAVRSTGGVQNIGPAAQNTDSETKKMKILHIAEFIDYYL